MSSEFIPIAFGITVGLLIAITTVLVFINQKKAHYDERNRKVFFEEVRDSMEKQIYMLNERLMKNDERWKDINHLLLRKEYTDDRPIILNKKVILNDFLKSNGISEKDLIIDKELIFVLTPFNSLFEDDYSKIRNVCLNVGFKCFRGDEEFFSSDIFPEMLRFIIKANLIIANLNGKNPNVLYELGIAQALDKPVILIAKNPENLPIDIKSKRFLIYKNLDELDLLLKNELIKLLRSQISEMSDNPKNNETQKNKIRITSAWYGIPNSNIDITNKVRDIVANNSIIKASNEVWGDPIPGKPKTLEIDCIIGEISKHISIAEGGTYKFE